MTYQFANNAVATLASGISNLATSITVATGKGALFPTPSGSDVFRATLVRASDAAVEIVNVTARSGDVMTVTRAQEGTTGLTCVAGDKFELRLTKAVMENVYQAGGTDVSVSDGGTGRSTGTTPYALIATGTTATGAQQTLEAGATTELLVGGGASALPVWTTATGSGSPVRATSPTLVTPTLGVATATSMSSGSYTTPSTAATTPTYGSDLLAGIGAFTDETGWTLGSGWSITGGQAVYTSGGGTLSATIAVTSGTKYQIDWTHVSGSYTITATIGAVSVSSSGTNRSLTLVAGATGSLTFSIAMSAGATIDALTVRAATTPGVATVYSALDASGATSLMMRITALSLNNTSYGVTSFSSNTTGYSCSAFGVSSLIGNTTGYSNSAFGVSSLLYNTVGFNNSAFGSGSLSANTQGYQNSGFGVSSLISCTSGFQNTGHGVNSLANVTTGYNNVAFGFNSGVGITTGTGNTILGANVTGLSAGLTNNIILANGTGAIKAQNDGTDWLLAGRVGFGTYNVAGQSFNVSRSITGATAAASIYTDATVASDVTSTARGFSSYLSTQATTFTLFNLVHYDANLNVIGAGSTVTNQYGFRASAALVGATNNYGFYSAIPDAANRWNFYAAGTAPNYFAGDLQLGKTVTAAGTTGAQTINKTAGTVNFAAAATSLVVTNSLVTANSIVICTVGTNDATLKSVCAVAGAGSITLTANAAATAETRVNFLVIN